MTNAIEEIKAINRSIGEIGSFVKERTDELGGDVTLLKDENERLRLDVGRMQERLRERRARGGGSRGRRGARHQGERREVRGVQPAGRWHHASGGSESPRRPGRASRPWLDGAFAGGHPLAEDRGSARTMWTAISRAWSGVCGKAYVQESLPGTLARDPEHQYRQVILPMLTHLRDVAIRAALDSTTVGSGDELVPTLERAELWMDVSLRTLVAGLIPAFPMPSQPFDIPTQLGDVNFFPGAENVAAASSAPGTSKVTLTAHELVAQVPFSFSLEEDNVLPSLLGEIRTSLVRSSAEVLDDIILNADTTQTKQYQRRTARVSGATPRAKRTGWWDTTA